MGDLVANFWRKAQEALKVADWAYQNGCGYLAVLKASLELMASLGLKPKDTIRIGYWVQTRFANECVHRRKLMPAESAQTLADLRDLRIRAEYTDEMISERLARQALKRAKEFLSAAERWLKL